MNIKRIAIVGCSVALVGAMTATAFAGTFTGNGMFANKGQQATITAAQVAENADAREVLKAERDADSVANQATRDADKETHQAEMTAMTEKWDALTDIEKEAVYQLQNDKIDAQMAIIDEYVALGLIDADRASEMKTNLTERIAELTTDSEFTMMSGFGNDRVEDNEQDNDQDADQEQNLDSDQDRNQNRNHDAMHDAMTD